MTGMIEGFFGFEIFDSRIFWVRKFDKYFFGGKLDFSYGLLSVLKRIGIALAAA